MNNMLRVAIWLAAFMIDAICFFGTIFCHSLDFVAKNGWVGILATATAYAADKLIKAVADDKPKEKTP